MSTEQTTNFRILKALMKQLQGYGLNPRDWRIMRESLDERLERIEMRHRYDSEFRFHGRLSQTREGKAVLSHLTLISI